MISRKTTRMDWRRERGLIRAKWDGRRQGWVGN
jgi:hypothetical protein